MDFELFNKRVHSITSRIQQLGGKVQEVVIDEPASPEQIMQMEEQLGVMLPKSFKQVLQEYSGNFSIRWFLPDNLERPHEFIEIFCGTPHWSLERLPEFEEGRKGWVDNVFSNPDDPYDAVWHHKLAFCEVGNGDYLAFDLKDSHDSIVYLSHEGGTGHGYKLANNFLEFIENWSRIGFVGCEDSQLIPFTTSPDSGIDADGEAAKRFRDWLELHI